MCTKTPHGKTGTSARNGKTQCGFSRQITSQRRNAAQSNRTSILNRLKPLNRINDIDSPDIITFLIKESKLK
ncbi:hypothetical protein BOC37_10130 [Burkholderia pseudomallei]|nr:hypothetical protein BOC37_10130 [Burkholderia pseudomallei]